LNQFQAPKEFLLLSSGTSISRLILDTPECPDAVVIGSQQKQRGINSLAWDGQDRTIYWIGSKSLTIKKAPENGADPPSNLFSGDEVFNPHDIVFDEVRRLLFWTCETYNSINVTETNGNNLGSVLSAGYLSTNLVSKL